MKVYQVSNLGTCRSRGQLLTSIYNSLQTSALCLCLCLCLMPYAQIADSSSPNKYWIKTLTSIIFVYFLLHKVVAVLTQLNICWDWELTLIPEVSLNVLHYIDQPSLDTWTVVKYSYNMVVIPDSMLMTAKLPKMWADFSYVRHAFWLPVCTIYHTCMIE